MGGTPRLGWVQIERVNPIDFKCFDYVQSKKHSNYKLELD